MSPAITPRPSYSIPPLRSMVSPMVLTTRELVREADSLALRIARASNTGSGIRMRDVRLVQELAARLGRPS